MKKFAHILSSIVAAVVLTAASASAMPASANNGQQQEIGSEIAPTTLAVKATSQGIDITVDDDDVHNVIIYALTGQIVKSAKVSYGTTSIDLKPGYYIVRTDDIAKRVIIR